MLIRLTEHLISRRPNSVLAIPVAFLPARFAASSKKKSRRGRTPSGLRPCRLTHRPAPHRMGAFNESSEIEFSHTLEPMPG